MNKTGGKHMSKVSIWGSENKKGRVIFFILGIALIGLAIFYFNSYIDKEFTNIEDLVMLLISPMLGVLGLTFIIINFNIQDSRVRAGLLIVVGIIIGGLIFNHPFRKVALILLVNVILMTIVTIFANTFVTTITLFIYSIIWVYILSALLKMMPTYDYALLYSCMTLCIVTYLFFATWINKKILKNMCNEDRSKDYNYNTLQDNLTVIYIIIFILLNVSAALYNDVYGVYNLINNSFITAITISRVNWKEIFKIKPISR